MKIVLLLSLFLPALIHGENVSENQVEVSFEYCRYNSWVQYPPFNGRQGLWTAKYTEWHHLFWGIKFPVNGERICSACPGRKACCQYCESRGCSEVPNTYMCNHVVPLLDEDDTSSEHAMANNKKNDSHLRAPVAVSATKDQAVTGGDIKTVTQYEECKFKGYTHDKAGALWTARYYTWVNGMVPLPGEVICSCPDHLFSCQYCAEDGSCSVEPSGKFSTMKIPHEIDIFDDNEDLALKTN